MNEADNINVARCITEKSHIGYDEMVNFCTGKTVRVDWVPLDWAAMGFLIVMFGAMAVGIGFIVAMLVQLYKDA